MAKEPAQTATLELQDLIRQLFTVFPYLRQVVPPEKGTVPANAVVDRWCLKHRRDPCVCGEPKKPRLGIVSGDATAQGRSSASLHLVDRKEEGKVLVKREKGHGANHDPSRVKRCQARASKTTIERTE